MEPLQVCYIWKEVEVLQTFIAYLLTRFEGEDKTPICPPVNPRRELISFYKVVAQAIRAINLKIVKEQLLTRTYEKVIMPLLKELNLFL